MQHPLDWITLTLSERNGVKPVIFGNLYFWQ